MSTVILAFLARDNAYSVPVPYLSRNHPVLGPMEGRYFNVTHRPKKGRCPKASYNKASLSVLKLS